MPILVFYTQLRSGLARILLRWCLGVVFGLYRGDGCPGVREEPILKELGSFVGVVGEGAIGSSEGEDGVVLAAFSDGCESPYVACVSCVVETGVCPLSLCGLDGFFKRVSRLSPRAGVWGGAGRGVCLLARVVPPVDTCGRRCSFWGEGESACFFDSGLEGHNGVLEADCVLSFVSMRRGYERATDDRAIGPVSVCLCSRG